MASLIVATGEQAGTQFLLGNRPLTGGRDPARDIQVVDPKASRKHFQIRKDGENFVIIELKSLNGVFINGTRINKEQILRDGDIITVGDTSLAFLLTDDPEKTNAALYKYKKSDRHVREDRTLSG